MFGWLARRFRTDPARGRSVFAYRDGHGGTRYVDPLVAWQEFEAAAGESWGEMFKVLGTKMPAIPGVDSSSIAKDLKAKQAEAAKELAEATSKALGVPALTPDGKGLTRAERIALAADFLAFMGRLADAARPFVNSPAPTAESPTA